MAETAFQSLYEYYRDEGFSPTCASLADEETLSAYGRGREILFRDLLHLPPAIFARRSLLEFGPDTGENALVFATWGANLTLVEPNPLPQATLRAYFEKFGLAKQLTAFEAVALESYRTDTKFDFIVAEGFIYTIQPSALWLNKLSGLLKSGGYAIVNYLVRDGCFFELLWKMLYARTQKLIGERGVTAAARLYGPKWASIPHTRPFESWVKDVLENPFVRLRYLVEPRQLCAEAVEHGLSLYSSWPRYEDPFDPFWHKKIPPPEIRTCRREDFLRRSRLSHMFGCSLFVADSSEDMAEKVQSALDKALVGIDGLIDEWCEPYVGMAHAGIGELRELVSSARILSETHTITTAVRVLDSIVRCLDWIESGNGERLLELVRSDQDLIDVWGSTTHYIVLTPQPSP